jgi:Spy/CpxP family protein refolding chaperone
MKRSGFFAASLLLVLFHSAPARAADDLPAPIVFVTNFLQLSNDQTSALITLIQTREAALQPIAVKLRGDQEQLGQLLESPSADAATAGRLLLEIHSGEKQVDAIARQFASSFEEILTPDQRQRLQFVRQAAQVEPAIPVFKAVGLL